MTIKEKKLSIMNHIILIIFSVAIISCNTKDNIYKRSILSMGTTLEIQIQTSDFAKADSAIDQAFAEMQRLNDKYTVYITDSYLNKINSSDFFDLDDETFFLLKKCEYYNIISRGAFDPAIGNIIKALGFDNTDDETIPEDSIYNYIEKNNWKLIELTSDKKIIKPEHLRINLGAIAKGYAVDRIFDIIKSFGFDIFLINAGGEIKCSGKDWEVGIQHPRKKDQIVGIIKINDLAVATSGDYERYKIQNGKRINHIFNPINGKVADQCQSVTVIAGNTLDADALATAVFVLGPIQGLKLIEETHNTEALIVDKDGQFYRSSGLKKYYFGN